MTGGCAVKDRTNLLSGSDVRGVALPGVAGQPVTLTGEDARDIAAAFAAWLAGTRGKPPSEMTVSVGHDPRLSSPDLAARTAEGLSRAGCRALSLGLCTTPAMFMSTLPDGLHCDGAVMITASHLPWNRNGMKFMTPEGGLSGDDIRAVLGLCGRAGEGSAGPVEAVEFLPRYAAGLVAGIREKTGETEPLRGLRIIVDAGNGAGGFFAGQVLRPLGADTTGSCFLDPDGRFPNHIPNPEDPEAMEAVSRAAVAAGADLGVIFDTDCDRAAVVGPDGRGINRNRLIALMSAVVLEQDPGGTIVTDSITSSGLADFIAGLGGVHHRFRRGYNNVIREARRLEAAGVSAPMAIETSGHCALRENRFLDDGAYLVTRLLIRMAVCRRRGGALLDLISGLREPAEEAELRLGVTAPDFAAYGQRVLDAALRRAGEDGAWTPAPDNHEGVRVSFGPGDGDGWFLLRLSLHDPALPLNIESDARGGARIIAGKLYPLLAPFDRLDLTALRSFIGLP